MELIVVTPKEPAMCTLYTAEYGPSFLVLSQGAVPMRLVLVPTAELDVAVVIFLPLTAVALGKVAVALCSQSRLCFVLFASINRCARGACT